MQKKVLRLLCFGLLGVFALGVLASGTNAAIKEEPILTIACISAIHTDYGLQISYPYMRESAKDAFARIAAEEDADVLLIGGDSTSDNGHLSNTDAWSYEVYQQVLNQFRSVSSEVAPYSLWACGNHDDEAGEDYGYDAYAGYESIMTDSCGTPLSIYRQKDDKTLTDQRYPEFILGLHYNLKGFDFIVLNAPYGQHLKYSSGTYQWLEKCLSAIGKGKTVFFLTYYPLSDGRNMSTPSYGITGSDFTRLKGILTRYPNLIYLHGHDHGNSESVFISNDTFERITSYDSAGNAVNKRNVMPTSFITSFMGSMSYYNCSLNNGWVNDEVPTTVQALMTYVYSDRIVFQMKNYGDVYGNKAFKAWTVMRDMSSYVATPSVNTDVSSNIQSAGSSGSSDTAGTGSSVSSSDTGFSENNVSMGTDIVQTTDSPTDNQTSSKEQDALKNTADSTVSSSEITVPVSDITGDSSSADVVKKN